MDLRFTADELAFRDEVRAFFREALPADIRRRMELGQRQSKDDIVRWQRILNAKGWAVPHWPVEWGGTRWGAVKNYIFKEEMQLAPAPDPLSFNVNMVGPVLVAFGSEEQKRRFLPKIANLDYWFCQGFSEPGAGSDLASLKTAARLEGDHYVVNGQKIWTSRAHHADWMFCLVRTDATAKQQRGISYLLIDMKTPGLTVRPIHTIDGEHHFNEVFFDDVRVPVENLVGEENKGWTYAKYLLGNERVADALRRRVADVLGDRDRDVVSRFDRDDPDRILDAQCRRRNSYLRRRVVAHCSRMRILHRERRYRSDQGRNRACFSSRIRCAASIANSLAVTGERNIEQDDLAFGLCRASGQVIEARHDHHGRRDTSLCRSHTAAKPDHVKLHRPRADHRR